MYNYLFFDYNKNTFSKGREKKLPILSICIPTWNRSGYLYFALKSIVDQEIFQKTNDIQIVVSDNCSTDLTPKIVGMFKEKYPDKIIYSRNDENIADRNFEKALSLGTGEVLKLHNDNFNMKEGSLEKMVNKIKELKKEKPMIFFANGNSRTGGDYLCENVDDVIKSCSYLITWIASFSMWKEQFDKFDDFNKNVHTYLTQTDVLLRYISSGNKIYVYDESIFESPGVLNKGGYNIAKTFGYSYLTFLNQYLDGNELKNKTYEYEKKDLFLNHIIPMRFVSAIKYSGWAFKNDGFLPVFI